MPMSVFRKSRMERAHEMLKSAASYTEDVLRDEQLRSDIRSAAGHAAVAAERVRQNSGLSEFAARVERDSQLRKNLRSLLDDLDSAGERVRRKKRHRVRNALLIIGGSGVTLAAIPNTRRWVASHVLATDNGGPPAVATPL
jgi:hypothetical protein